MNGHDSRQDWLEQMITAASGKSPSPPLPGFPDAETQRRTTGAAGAATLHEAFQFYIDVVETFERLSGRALNDQDRILDFGTGWGRVLRFFIREVGLDNCFGTDIDPQLVACARTLFNTDRFSVNPAFPPTAYDDQSFSLIIGYSVFSHLSEAACRAWMKEFYRLLQPDGLLALTTRGRWFFDYCQQLNEIEEPDNYQKGLATLFPDFDAARARYDAGEFVHATSVQVGGGASLGAAFYGETFIPAAYAGSAYQPLMALREFQCLPGLQTHPILFFAPQLPGRGVPEAATPLGLEGENADWPEEIRRLCHKAGARYQVCAQVHPEDFIFRFACTHPGFSTPAAAIGYYFLDGRRSALKVRDLIITTLPHRKAPLKVLEFASGYGAVTRHASRLLPHSLSCCDIHPAANAFNARHFGVTTLASSEIPEALELPHHYDLIFVLSFFSHMPRTTWTR
jgi:SAM-dependent methyltransferase